MSLGVDKFVLEQERKTFVHERELSQGRM